MSLAATVVSVDVTNSKIILSGTLVPSGSYAAGGDTLDLTKLIGTSELVPIFLANNPPLIGIVSTSTGYLGAFIPGTTLANGKVKFIVSSTGSEVAAGTYASGASGLTTDANINFRVIFDKLL